MCFNNTSMLHLSLCLGKNTHSKLESSAMPGKPQTISASLSYNDMFGRYLSTVF